MPCPLHFQWDCYQKCLHLCRSSSRYGKMSFSLMSSQMTRVISSPCISTTEPALIFWDILYLDGGHIHIQMMINSILSSLLRVDNCNILSTLKCLLSFNSYGVGYFVQYGNHMYWPLFLIYVIFQIILCNLHDFSNINWTLFFSLDSLRLVKDKVSIKTLQFWKGTFRSLKCRAT